MMDKCKKSHKSCEHKECVSVEDIVEGVCNSIVGETYYKWDSTTRFLSAIVFLFLEAGVCYPKRSQIKTRLVSCEPGRVIEEPFMSDLRQRVKTYLADF